MKAIVLNEETCGWCHEKIKDDVVDFKGGYWYRGVYYSGFPACQQLHALFHSLDIAEKKDKIATTIQGEIVHLGGHFSFIIDAPNFVLAFVDKIRSYPLFYNFSSDGLCISNSAWAVQSHACLRDIDAASVVEFRMAGYVTGPYTIYEGLRQLQSGEFLFYNKQTSRFFAKRHFVYLPTGVMEIGEDDLLEKHHELVRKTFSKVIDTVDGRPVWIPLSGGLDSRLILAMLLEFRYDNVVTFTYGIPQLWEVKYAREIAKIANVRWHYIQYVPRKTRKVFHSGEREEYYRFASGLCSVPFVNDYFALKLLIEEGLISKECIVINGQSGDFLTGGHIPISLESYRGNTIDVDFLAKLVIDKHYSLWLDQKTPSNVWVIRNRIKETLGSFLRSTMTLDELAYYYELQEWQERQSKYVVNGQRTYEWFQLDWKLPLWSEELIEFWRNVGWRNKIGQQLFKKYLIRYNPGKLFRVDIRVNRDYCPLRFKVLSLSYSVLAKIFDLDPDSVERTFIKYYGAYSPFYPQGRYKEYLRDSKYHRNYVSYHSKILLEDCLNRHRKDDG